MKKLLIIALFIIGCAPKIRNSYVGMTEQEFKKKKPNLDKHAIQKSILGNAAIIVVDPETDTITYIPVWSC